MWFENGALARALIEASRAPSDRPSFPHAGSTQDTTLLDIVPLLELIWKQDVQDARAVCRSYHGKNVVEEFRRRDRAPVVRQPTAAPARRRFGFG